MQRSFKLAFVILLVFCICLPATAQGAQKAIPSLDLYLKVGARYDTNVQLEPLDQDLYANEDDFLGVVYFSGRYKLVNRKPFEVSAGYSHYQTFHNDIANYDLVGSIGNVNAKYRLKNFTFGLTYQPSHYIVDYHSFITYHKVKPEVLWKIRDNLLARLAYSYTDNNHLQDDNRDGQADAGSLDVYYIFSKKRGTVFAGGSYEKNNAEHDDYDYYQVRTHLGVMLNLPWELKIVVTGKYDQKRYIDVDSSFNKKREDDKYMGTVSLSRKLFYDWLGVVLDYTYTSNNSNITEYEYNKHDVTISFTIVY